MTVRLRAHHLLCLLTYAGRGYSPAFVANMDEVAARLSAGEEVLIVAGPDEICAPLLQEDEPHCLKQSVRERDERAAADVTALLGRAIVPGSRLRLDEAALVRLREAFGAGAVRSACTGCEWAGLCSTIAEGRFLGARLQGSAAIPSSPDAAP